MSSTVREYYNEHPFHDYVFIYGRSTYFSPIPVLDKYVIRIEREKFRVVLYVDDEPLQL